MKYYVYVYKDPITKQPFYIGKGSGNRYLDHANKPYQSFKRVQDKIKNIRNKGLEPIIEFIYKQLTEDIAYTLEEELIVKYGRKDIDPNGILMNICLGATPPTYKNNNLIEAYYSDKTIELTDTLIKSVKVFLENTKSRKRFTSLLKSSIGKDFICATKHFPQEYNVPQRLWHIEHGLKIPTCKTCGGAVSFKAFIGSRWDYATYCSNSCLQKNPEYVNEKNERLIKQAYINAENNRGKTYSNEHRQAISNAKKGMEAPHQWTVESKEKLSATHKRKRQENNPYYHG